MKISTALFYKTSSEQMSSQQSKVSSLQAKLGTGNQILNPSEDTSKAATISRLESARAKQDTFLHNVGTAQTRLTLEEASMESMTEAMQRITELNIQAASDTSTSMDRRIIANEVRALRDELLKMLNTQDVNGDYIFSGSKTRTPSFMRGADGIVEYTGDQTRTSVNVSEVRTIEIVAIFRRKPAARDLWQCTRGLSNDGGVRSDDSSRWWVLGLDAERGPSLVDHSKF